MEYVIKLLREECTGVNTELREVVDTDPEQGVYYVGNYKTHQNERFTVLTEARQRHQELLQEWRQEEEAARIAAMPKPNAQRLPDFHLPTSYL